MLDEKTGFSLPLGWDDRVGDRTHLYFIRSGEFLKIGLASNIDERLRHFRLYNPHPLTVDRLRWVPTIFSRQLEKRVHDTLSAHAIGREWFSVDADTAYATARPLIALAWLAQRRIKDRSFGSTDGNLRALIEKNLEIANA